MLDLGLLEDFVARWRKLIGALAVAGMLVHAWALMSHQIVSLSQHLGNAVASQGLAFICRADAAATSPDDGVTGGPTEPSNSSSCPLCLGCGPSAVVLPSFQLTAFIHSRLSVCLEIVAETITRRLAHLRPPTRGPPLNV